MFPYCGEVMPVFKRCVCVHILSLSPSKVIISLQNRFFLFYFFAMKQLPQKHVKHQTLQATNTFLYLNLKKKN